MMTGAKHFFEGGHAFANLEQTIIKKIAHPLGFSMSPHLLGRSTLESHFAQFSIQS